MSEIAVGFDGEWEAKAAEKEVLKIVGDIVQNYIENGNDEKFICFASSIAHAKELQGQFISVGVNAQTYTADDDSEDKKDIVAEFDKPDSLIRGLISVSALIKGYDCAAAKLLIIARPIRKAMHDHIQMLGRIMRIFEGKEFGRVFDHAGNCARFWWRTTRYMEKGLERLNKGEKEATEESAKADKEKPKPEPIKCPSCGVLHLPMPICGNCGFEFPKRSMVETVPGSLKEIIATGNQKMMVREVWPQVVDYVLKKGHTGEEAQRKAQGIYKNMTGEFAKARVETTVAVDCTAEVRGKIVANFIRYAKGKAKARA